METALSNLYPILPIVVVMITGMVVLLGDACVPFMRHKKELPAGLSGAGVLLALFFAVLQLTQASPGLQFSFSGAIIGDAFAQVCNVILLVTALLAVLLGTTYLENRKLNLGEYYALVLFSTSGAMLMAGATDLIVLFVAIEILSVALYVLAGFARTEERSEEAALKYFLLGAFASGFLLYGIALIYGGSAGAVHIVTTRGGPPILGGSTRLYDLYEFLSQLITAHRVPSVMLMAGIALLLVGLAFKAALVPFHMWTPDVYQGAPTSVTAYMAASAKIGAFAAILRVFHALIPIQEYWLIAFQVLAVLTMFGGNILAVTQDNVKRMLAYSSIAHAGYLLVAVVAMTSGQSTAREAAIEAAVFYLLAYTLMTMGAFAVLIWLSRQGRDVQTLNDLKGLARTDPIAAYTMLIFMLSLGGIPPTMGFMGKWFLFNAILASGHVKLAILLALASIISVYYYLKVVWMMCFQEPETAAPSEHAIAPLGVKVTLFVTGVGSLVFGIIPGLLNWMITNGTATLRP